jgi:ABC-2 type transport system permease protein
VNLVNATRAEFSKLLTVRLWWILAIVLFVYVGFTAGLLAGVFTGLIDSTGDQLPAALADVHLIVYSSASSIGYVFPVLLGALVTTSEFRHQTLTPTFLANPRRGQVLLAKVITLAVFGAFYGAVAVAASVGVGGAVLSVTGGDAMLDSEDTWLLMARAVVAMALWGAVGVGLGAVVPNQVAVIVILLAFTQFLEPVLRLGASVWEWTARLGQYLPGAASDALVGASVFSIAGPGGPSASTMMLEWWQGGLVLLAMALVATAIGYFTTWKRDVT